MINNTMLRCSKCGETKQPHEFAANRHSKTGMRSECRSCQSSYFATYYATHKKQACKPVVDRPASDQLYLLSYPWENSPIKVGRAHDVFARVCQLEGGHNFRLNLLAVFPGQGAVEHGVHAILSKHKATGGRGQEWFQVSLEEALLAVAACVHPAPPVDLNVNETSPKTCHSAM